MSRMTVAVTAGALAHRESQGGQIAIRGAIPHFQDATRDRQVRILVGGLLPLRVGDTAAIWEVHQRNTPERAAFEAVFAALSVRVGADCPLDYEIAP